MKPIQIILIIIGVLILIGLVAGFSYWLGQQSVKVKSEITTSNPLESKIIKNWRAEAVGVIVDKRESDIAIESNGESLLILVSPKTSIEKIILENKEKNIEEVVFEDINIGDKANIKIGVDQTGQIWAESVKILPK